MKQRKRFTHRHKTKAPKAVLECKNTKKGNMIFAVSQSHALPRKHFFPK